MRPPFDTIAPAQDQRQVSNLIIPHRAHKPSPDSCDRESECTDRLAWFTWLVSSEDIMYAVTDLLRGCYRLQPAGSALQCCRNGARETMRAAGSCRCRSQGLRACGPPPHNHLDRSSTLETDSSPVPREDAPNGRRTAHDCRLDAREISTLALGEEGSADSAIRTTIPLLSLLVRWHAIWSLHRPAQTAGPKTNVFLGGV